MNSPNDTNPLLYFPESLPIDAIALRTLSLNDARLGSMDHAVQIGLQSVGEARQWQTYLNALSLLTFKAWLQARSPQLALQDEACSVLWPPAANFIEAVTNLQVGAFRVCLIVTGSLGDERVMLPRAVLDLPEYVAHFYVVVEILEDAALGRICGFLTYPQLVALQQSGSVLTQADWTYELPFSCFNLEPDRLLLYLRCLEPTAIVLPAVPARRSATLPQLQQSWDDLLPQVTNPERSLWQVVTWEQGQVILTQPALLEGLYRLQTGDRSVWSQVRDWGNPIGSPPALTQRILNTGVWLQNQLDEVAQSLAWILLPPLMPAAPGLRSQQIALPNLPETELQSILTALQQAPLALPEQVYSAYQDLQLATVSLRLYVTVWATDPLNDHSEWGLLMVVGTPGPAPLPLGRKLEIKDQVQTLVERLVSAETPEAYLYACVLGARTETFEVTLSLREGAVLVLPPFAFQSEG